MWSTRARLAATYAGLMFVTLLVFSVAIYIARPPSAFQELSRRAASEAQLVRQRMVQVRQSGQWLTQLDSSLVPFTDSLGVVRDQSIIRNGDSLVVRDTARCLARSWCSW